MCECSTIDLEMTFQSQLLTSIIEKDVNRSQCERIISLLRSETEEYAWEEKQTDSDAVRAIERALKKRSVLNKSNKREQLEQWRETSFVQLAIKNGSIKPTADVRHPVGPPSGSSKRLSDGTVKKTENKILDEIVAYLEAKAVEHRISKLGVIQIIRNAKKGIFQLPTYHMYVTLFTLFPL